MKDRLIGAHMPTAGGIHQAVLKGKEIGCGAVQVFTASPRMWNAKPVDEQAPALLRNAKDQTGIQSVVSHDSYLINLAAVDETVLSKSLNAFIEEINRCHILGIQYVVSHMGAHLGKGEAEGIKKLAESVKIVLSETPNDVSIAMETTAGQGSSLGYRFEHLAEVMELCGGNDRLVVCVDTCHLFAGGYDITTQESFTHVFDEFEKLIGLQKIKVIHANDAVKPLGSRVDRHAHIGEGCIGMDAFKFLVNEPGLVHAPIIIETPDEARFEEQIGILRSLLN